MIVLVSYSGFVRVLKRFGVLWKLMMQFSKTWKVLEKDCFSKWPCESFGFLFGKILKYPKMDIIS